MKGYILTNQQYTDIQGKYYTTYQFFNCVQDINAIWFLFLSNEDKAEISNTEFSWILDLTQGEYIPPTPPPFPPIN
jgi:hypothetical protein